MLHLSVWQNVGLCALLVGLTILLFVIRAKAWGTGNHYHLEVLYPWTKIMMILVVLVGFVLSVVGNQFVWVVGLPAFAVLFLVYANLSEDFDWLTSKVWPELRRSAAERRAQRTHWVDRMADAFELIWSRIQKWLEEGEKRRAERAAEAVLLAQKRLADEGNGGAAENTV